MDGHDLSQYRRQMSRMTAYERLDGAMVLSLVPSEGDWVSFNH